VVLNALLIAFLKVTDLVLTIYTWLIIIRCIVSWFVPFPYHPALRVLYRLTEPVLAPFRRIIPPIAGLDLSPLVVIFIIYFLQILIHQTLISLVQYRML